MKDIAISINKNLSDLCSKQSGIISQLFGSNHLPNGYTTVMVVNGYAGSGMLEISRESTKGKKQVTQVKVGRVIYEAYEIRFGVILTPDVIEKTSRDLIGLLENFEKDELQIVEGEDIIKYYLDVNYLYPGKGQNNDTKGSLSKSCMRNSTASEYIKLYAANPDKIKMVIRKSGDKLVARALLWFMDDNKVLLDRCYYTDESELTMFALKAKKMGWYYYIIIGGERYIYFDGKRVDQHNFKVSLKLPGNHKYPFLDTVIWFYPMDDYWSTNPSNPTKMLVKMQTTNGMFSVQSIDYNYSISDVEFDRCKPFLKTNDGRSFDTSKLSFAKKIEYGKVFGNIWKYVTKNKWSNDMELLEFLKNPENAKTMTGTIDLWDCDYKYIKEILYCIGNNNGVDYRISGNFRVKGHNELLEDLFKEDNDQNLLVFIVNILEQAAGVDCKNVTIMKEIFDIVSSDDKHIKVLTRFKNSYLDTMLKNFDTNGEMKKKLIAHIKGVIDSKTKVDDDACAMAALLNGLVNTTKDSTKIEEEIRNNYDKFIEKLYASIPK